MGRLDAAFSEAGECAPHSPDLVRVDVVFLTQFTVGQGEPDERLWGCHIDEPADGAINDGLQFETAGWVSGRHRAPVAVDVLKDGVPVRRLPMNVRRPDLQRLFPHAGNAHASGFWGSLAIPGVERFELRLEAVLEDGTQAPIGAIRGWRGWKDEVRDAGVPLVSVVIPCFNQARFLVEAIESVLAQTYPHVELVVVDDGSTDNCGLITQRYPDVRYIHQSNQGKSAACNVGIQQSVGSFLVFLDADDRLLPTAIDTGLTRLAAHPKCAFTSGHCRSITCDGKVGADVPGQVNIENEHYLQLLATGNYVCHPAAIMFRRTALELVGGFSTSLKNAEEYELCLRIARSLPVDSHAETVSEYRVHGGNKSSHHMGMLRAHLSILNREEAFAKKLGSRYEEACRLGRAVELAYYGPQAAAEVASFAATGQWKRAVLGVAYLARHYPRGLAWSLAGQFQATGFAGRAFRQWTTRRRGDETRVRPAVTEG